MPTIVVVPVALIAVPLTAMTVNVLPSGSVSLARTLPVATTVPASATEAVSATATGLLLWPVTLTVRVEPMTSGVVTVAVVFTVLPVVGS